MKNLLEITGDGKLKINPAFVGIKEFKDIWEGDNPTEELTYVYLYADWQSPYQMNNDSKKAQAVKKACISKPAWKETKKIKDAIKKYEELQNTTTSIILLIEAEKAAIKIKDYLTSIDLSKDEGGKMTEKLISNIQSLGGLAKNLREQREQVEQEIKASTSIKGNTTIKKRERI